MFVVTGRFKDNRFAMAKDPMFGQLYWSRIDDKNIIYFNEADKAKNFIQKLKDDNDAIYTERPVDIVVAKISLNII